MNRFELIRLKRLVSEEILKRNRVKELLRNDLVQEYLQLTDTEARELDSGNILEIVDKILETFTITKTNDIYVCTSAWYTDYHICYEESDNYSEYVPIDSDDAEHKVYVDIESKRKVHAVKRLDISKYTENVIEDFERENIVLNPHNTCDNQNGYNEVRYDFFYNAFQDGQTKSKQIVLSKYPRL